MRLNKTRTCESYDRKPLRRLRMKHMHKSVWRAEKEVPSLVKSVKPQNTVTIYDDIKTLFKHMWAKLCLYSHIQIYSEEKQGRKHWIVGGQTDTYTR